MRNKREIKIAISLFILAIFSCVLFEQRSNILGEQRYAFLVWNLFLALIPYGISGVMLLVSSFTKTKWWLFALVPLGVVWLIFFPNAPYLLTDYAHFSWVGFFLEGGTTFTLQPWFDFILFSSFILCGMLAGLASLQIVHNIAEKYFGKIFGWIIVLVVNFLTGWAIYLGRFIRLNSWDLREPEVLIPHIQLSGERMLFVVVLSVFLMLLYIVVHNFSGRLERD